MTDFNKAEKKTKVEFDEAVHGNTLAQLIKEASDQKTIQEAYGDKIKDIKQRAKEELGVDGKMWTTLFNMYHKQSREKFEEERDEAVELYDRVFNA